MAVSEVYTVRLYHGNPAAGSSTPTQNVPSGFVWVITDIEAWISPATGNFVRIQDARTAGPIVELGHQTTQAGNQWSGRICLPEGGGFLITSFGAASWVTVTGYQLTDSPT